MICSGPMRAGAHTYALAAERVARRRPGPRGATPTPTPTGSWRRPTCARTGPRRSGTSAWWAGLPVGAVRTALEAARPGVRSILVRGRRYFGSPGTPPGDGGGEPVVHLLPGFNEFVVAYSESRVLADPHGAGPGCRGPRGVLSPSLTVDGRIVGGWRRRVLRARGAEAVEVVVTCFVPLAPGARAGSRTRPVATRRPSAGRCGSSWRSEPR